MLVDLSQVDALEKKRRKSQVIMSGGRQALCVESLEGRGFSALAAVVHGEVGPLGVASQ